MTDLSLDVEFATAALVPEDRLPDMRECLDGRIREMFDTLQTLPAHMRADISNEIDSLIECRSQIVARECLPADMATDHMIELIEKGIISHIAQQMLDRSVEALRGRYNNAVFATEIALRFNVSREATELLFTLTHDFLVALNIDTDLMPNQETVRREVDAILAEVRKAVSACDA